MPEGGFTSFEYVRPTDWSEAARLLAEHGAVAKMGGCDVLTRHRSGRLQARLVVGLNGLPGVGDLTFSREGAHIGAAVTLAQLDQTPQFVHGWPVLSKVIGNIASPAIRTSATFVGNVAQGWGVSDIVPLLQVCEAELEVRSPAGERLLAVAEYAKTPGTSALRPGEVIVALRLKPLSDSYRMAYERFAIKRAFALPLVSIAIGVSLRGGSFGDVRIAAVGGSPMPARCPQVEAALNGQRQSESTVDAAVAAMVKWANPRTDHRGSAEYRRHLLAVLLRRAVEKLTRA